MKFSGLLAACLVITVAAASVHAQQITGQLGSSYNA
jgi:hypothetical protein